MQPYGIGISASEARQALKKGDISILELVEAHVRRIEDVNGRINAVIYPMFEQALEQARAASKALKKNSDTGKLFGIPITLKDQFMVRGTPASCGLSNRTSKRMDQEDSLVSRLREEGAIILGKTNLPQLLFSHECEHAHYGRAKNPWNLERTTGGSSGGEAGIIAAGGSMLDLGGDMGGSLRVPAHCCGIHAIKPTSGRLPNDDTPPGLGYFAEFAGFEGFVVQPGPMARSVEDLKTMLDCFLYKPLKSMDSYIPHSWSPGSISPPDGLRIGIYTDNTYFPVSPAISRVVSAAAKNLEDAGLSVGLFIPPDPTEGMNIYMSLLSADGGQWIKNALNGEQPTSDVKSFMQLAGLPNSIRPGISKLLSLMGQKFASSSILNAGRLSVHKYWETTMRRTNYRTRFLESMNAQNIDLIRFSYQES